MEFKLWLESNMMKVYRGLAKIRPIEDGAYGPGVYFYDNLKDAIAYSERDGGVIEAEINPNHPDVKIHELPVTMVGTNYVLRHQKVIVVTNLSIINIIQIIPNDQL